jgi:hypothetical protein
MLPKKLRLLLTGVILIMAFFSAPSVGATGLNSKQASYYNGSPYLAWDHGYRGPRGDYGYRYDWGYSLGYPQPPYHYHGRVYHPHDPQTQEHTVPRDRGPQGYYKGYDEGYHDGYRDATEPYSGGAIYLHKGDQW